MSQRENRKNTRRENRKYTLTSKAHDAKSTYLELKKIWDAQRALGWIELDKPHFLGYIKSFVLRDDITRRKDVAVFEGVLKAINNFVVCKDKSFTQKDWQSKKKVAMTLGLKRLNKKEFNKLTDKQKRLFREYYSHKRHCWVYEFVDTHYFVTKVEKHWAHKVREYDADLAKREGEIEHYIDSHNMWPRINKVMGWRRRSSWDRCDIGLRKNKEKAQPVEMY